MDKNDYPSTLKERALELLANRPITYTLDKISEDTGISKAWLAMFSLNKVKEPGVGKVQRLYEYLSESKLKV